MCGGACVSLLCVGGSVVLWVGCVMLACGKEVVYGIVQCDSKINLA